MVLLDDDATTSSSAMALAGGAYSNFIDTIKSDKTRKQYKRCLVKFMRFASITEVDNLLVLAGDPKALQQKIIDYVSYLKARRLSAVTIWSFPYHSGGKTLLLYVLYTNTLQRVSD